jgi:hypothetical protein
MPAFWSYLKHRCAVKCKKKLVNKNKKAQKKMITKANELKCKAKQSKSDETNTRERG